MTLQQKTNDLTMNLQFTKQIVFSQVDNKLYTRKQEINYMP